MKRFLIAALAALTSSGGAQAQAASFTVPSFTLTGPASTGVTCTHSGCIWPRICGALQWTGEHCR
jgi:hypothetical protein